MSDLGNKEVMARNLKTYIKMSGKTQKELAELVNVAPSTFNAWVQAKKYPRIDKIETLANYFNILKSDLIEDKAKTKKSNEAIVDIIAHIHSDSNFLYLVQRLMQLDSNQVQNLMQLDENQVQSVQALLQAFLKK